jgi:hypothetical protein
MAGKFVRQDQVIEAAIDELLNDHDEPETDGLIELHKSSCANHDAGTPCTCEPRTLLVPPAKIGDIWAWLRKLDAVTRDGP